MDAKRAREAMEQLPVKEVEKSLSEFLKPVLEKIPDKRLREGVSLAVRGIITSESPIILRMAQAVERTKSSVWAAAKRMYRMLKNQRYSNTDMEEGMATIARQSVEKDGLLLSHYIADRIAPKTQYVVIFVSYNNRRDTHRDGYVKIIAQYVVLIRYKLLHIVVV